MFVLSKGSLKGVETCNDHIQGAVNFALQFLDFGVIEGHRDRDTQNLYYEQKKTQLKWPLSTHNTYPSNAVDLLVYVRGMGYITEKTAPEKWRQYYGYLAGILRAYCDMHGLKFRWGGDWSSDDGNFNNQKFDDLVHFEISL